MTVHDWVNVLSSQRCRNIICSGERGHTYNISIHVSKCIHVLAYSLTVWEHWEAQEQKSVIKDKVHNTIVYITIILCIQLLLYKKFMSIHKHMLFTHNNVHAKFWTDLTIKTVQNKKLIISNKISSNTTYKIQWVVLAHYQEPIWFRGQSHRPVHNKCLCKLASI